MTTTTTSSELVHGTARRLDKVSWGALLAGFFVGVGALFLLLSLGAAVGLTSVDARDLSSWKNMGIGVGIWGGISAIVAAFFSAWAAARLSTAVDRRGGMLHGAALWGLTWAVGLWLGAMAVGGAVGGAAKAAGTAAQTAATGANAASPQQKARAQASAPSEREVKAQAREKLDDVKANADEIGEKAATGGKAGAWGAFLAALFTLGASALGGMMGIPERGRAALARSRAPDTRATLPPDPAPHRA
jgi:hypothetical protein